MILLLELDIGAKNIVLSVSVEHMLDILARNSSTSSLCNCTDMENKVEIIKVSISSGS